MIWMYSVFSLLDILAGRKDKSGLTGQVMVNGEQQPSNFKCISGYVVQVSDLKYHHLHLTTHSLRPFCASSTG